MNPPPAGAWVVCVHDGGAWVPVGVATSEAEARHLAHASPLIASTDARAGRPWRIVEVPLHGTAPGRVVAGSER